MRIAILGDFHLGYDRFYEDSFNQAEKALKIAEENADVLLIAGDIFDAKVPKPEVMGRSLEIFSKIRKSIFVIHGTHERRPQGFVNPIDLLIKAGKVISCHLKPTFFEKENEKIMIYGMGGVPEEYSKIAIEKLNPKPIENVFSIFMFHQNLKEFMPQVEHGLYIEDLPNGFDLYIDGHLHKNYEINKSNKELIIPGSTVLTQLRKEEKVKGFYIYDTKMKMKRFVEIPTRKFYYLEFESNSTDDLMIKRQKIIELMESIDFNNKPIVRLDFISKIDFADSYKIESLKDE